MNLGTNSSELIRFVRSAVVKRQIADTFKYSLMLPISPILSEESAPWFHT